jgi:hypothetical protein
MPWFLLETTKLYKMSTNSTKCLQTFQNVYKLYKSETFQAKNSNSFAENLKRNKMYERNTFHCPTLFRKSLNNDNKTINNPSPSPNKPHKKKRFFTRNFDCRERRQRNILCVLAGSSFFFAFVCFFIFFGI